MASPIPKQLAEILKEKQEPFDLEDYLYEREYMRIDLNSKKTSFRCCCSANSRRFLKRSATWGLTKRMKVVQTCSKMVKPLFEKLLCVVNNQRMKRTGWSNRKRVESDRFSPGSCTSVFDSCSESDNEDGEPNFFGKSGSISSTADTYPSLRPHANLVPNDKQVVTGKNFRWRCREDNNKELSPVSVLEVISSEENSPDQENNRERNAETVDVSAAIPSPKFMEPQSGHLSYSYSSSYKHLTATRIFQLSKQFLFDFVRELVDIRSQKGRREDEGVMGFLADEQIEKILCEDMKRWNKLGGSEFNVTELMSSDLKESGSEWGDYETQIREISSEIGDAILDDVIRNEVVFEDGIAFLMWDSCSSYDKGVVRCP